MPLMLYFASILLTCVLSGCLAFYAWRQQRVRYYQGQVEVVEALRESEERYQLANHATFDVVWDWNLQTNAVWWNDKFQALFGYRPEEIEPGIEAWTRPIHPDDRVRVEAGIYAAIDSGQGSWFDQYRFRRKDGQYAEVEDRGFIRRDANGKPVRMIGAMQDVTERKRAEDALRASEVRYHRLFETAMDGILVLDAETGMVLDVNPFLTEMLGFSHEQFLEKNIWELGFFGNIAASQARFAELRHQEYVRYEDLPLETAAGRPIRVEFVSNIYQVNYHKVIQCNIRDITERRRAETQIQAAQAELQRLLDEADQSRRALLSVVEDQKTAEEEIRILNTELELRVIERTAQLESANKELETFAYSVSHDLRAPLRGIDGWSLVLLEDCGDQLDAQARQYLGRVRTEAQRMGQLIDALLQLSRVTRAEMQRRPVDLSALARTVVARLRESQPERQAEIGIQPDLTTYGDARQLEIVLTNLLGNAWKFTGARPLARIEFGQTEVEGRPAFYVHDNGAGFDMAYAQNLFGAFQRMHAATEFPGTGIGLATVQRIVQRHGGRTWAEAVVDGGATFYFTLDEAV